MSTYPNTLESILGPNLESILSELEDIYPQVTPSPEDSLETIMYRSGQRSVVDWINNRINNDDTNSTTN